ncbi:hypothetical protein FOL47_007454 [Perkinsus chesapeaki]|uniref:Uncharacterized protein n=1 Tax=Perkinsus chesapeaki TaxID=330153 RepID=A0A7J6LLH1_PERCH|nr:hypothetical protein FOL47_007454 [Perkinsus chesapeaki]
MATGLVHRDLEDPWKLVSIGETIAERAAEEAFNAKFTVTYTFNDEWFSRALLFWRQCAALLQTGAKDLMRLYYRNWEATTGNYESFQHVLSSRHLALRVYNSN